MTKYTTEWTVNERGEIVRVDYIDGEVVDEGATANDTGGASFFSEAQYNDNGREYNSTSGDWEYTADRSGNGDPFACDYDPPQDINGSVPLWDGE